MIIDGYITPATMRGRDISYRHLTDGEMCDRDMKAFMIERLHLPTGQISVFRTATENEMNMLQLLNLWNSTADWWYRLK